MPPEPQADQEAPVAEEPAPATPPDPPPASDLPARSRRRRMPLQARSSDPPDKTPSFEEPEPPPEPPSEELSEPEGLPAPAALPEPVAPEPIAAVLPPPPPPELPSPEPVAEPPNASESPGVVDSGFERPQLFSPAPQPAGEGERIAPPALLNPIPVQKPPPTPLSQKTPIPRSPIDFSKPPEAPNRAGDRPPSDFPKSFQDEEDDDWFVRTGQPAPTREYLGEDVDVAPTAPPKKPAAQPWVLVLVGLGGLFLVAVFLMLIAFVL